MGCYEPFFSHYCHGDSRMDEPTSIVLRRKRVDARKGARLQPALSLTYSTAAVSPCSISLLDSAQVLGAEYVVTNVE